MKNLILFIFVICGYCFSFASPIVEGRTWWYTSMRRYGPRPMQEDEFAISIGKPVEIDGVEWNELLVTMSAIKLTDIGNDFYGDWEYNNSPSCVSYIREDNGKVFIKFDFEKMQSYEPLDEFIFGYTMWPNVVAWSDNEVPMYSTGDTGDCISFGCEDSDFYISTSVKSVTDETSHGNTFTVYNYDLDNTAYIEGIGMKINNCVELILAPFGMAMPATDVRITPRLRYVTDAENNILYEGIGGTKLWNEYNGFTDVYAQDNEAEIWFNLQGLQIDKPTTPGIYILKRGLEAKKVVVAGAN